jgi:hypothetical protein
MPKKKFKETKVGKFLIEKLPGIAADVLPDKGVLGIAKNLLNIDKDLSSEEKAQMHKELVELYELEVSDRDSARKREVELAKVGKVDYMHYITGIVGLGIFVYIVYALTHVEIPKENKELWVHLIGITEGIVIGIYAYHYGSKAKKD